MAPVAFTEAIVLVVLVAWACCACTNAGCDGSVVSNCFSTAKLNTEDVALVVVLVPLTELNDSKTVQVVLVTIILQNVKEAFGCSLNSSVNDKLNLSPIRSIKSD